MYSSQKGPIRKNSTYVRYLTILTIVTNLDTNLTRPDTTFQTMQNERTATSNNTNTYKHTLLSSRVTNYPSLIPPVKFVNSQYTTPVMIEFENSGSNNTNNLAMKHR